MHNLFTPYILNIARDFKDKIVSFEVLMCAFCSNIYQNTSASTIINY